VCFAGIAGRFGEKPKILKTEQLMKTKILLGLLFACGLIAAGLTGCASQKETHAKLSKADAEKIALAKVPNGSIKEGELEKEHGKLIWSFDIATTGTTDITEVQVDAITGVVASMEKETAAEQEKERQEDAKSSGNEKEDKD
jgi:hypothetical protein